MNKHSKLYRLAYSTDPELRPTGTGTNEKKKSQRQRDTPRDGFVRLRRETKGRGGKTVTTVSGLPLQHAQLNALATELKKSCGTGGAVKSGTIEIQGDHRDRLTAALEDRGYKVKLAGG